MMTDEKIAALSHGDLLDLHFRLGVRLDAMRNEARRDAIKKARELCEAYGIDPVSIFGMNPWSGRKPRKPMPFKYRDPVSGKTWLGMGRTPKWLVGRDPDHFKVPNLVG